METKPGRLKYIDNIRLLVIILVVVQHIAVTYSGMGSWYYKEGAELGVVQTSVFSFYESFMQAFFMGILFLIAGYFTPFAYDRKGFGAFVKDRFIRLCVPALIYMLVINPFIWFILLNPYWTSLKPDFLNFYSGYIAGGHVLSGSGPLWFAIALFLFSVAYGLVRLARRPRGRAKEFTPRVKHLVTLILIIAAFAFLIRLAWPIGTSAYNMMLCNFAQYIVLFIAGIFSYRNNIFEKLPAGEGRWWLFAALAPGYGVWSAIMLVGGALNNYEPFCGGVTWQSAAFSLWESFTAVAVSVGLITRFREKYNYQSPLVEAMSKSAFAVYVFHSPIIIAAALLVAPLALLPIMKSLLMCIICVPVCFAATHFAFLKIPLLKKVL